MRHRLIIGIAVMAILGATGWAAAADLPVKAPVYKAAVPVFSWTGWYVGVNAGYGWSNADFSLTPTGAWPTAGPASIPFLVATNKTLHPRGFMGGAQAGFNYQMNQVVWGVEGDFDFYRASDSFLGGAIPTTSIVSYTQDAKQTWLATLRGRVGWAVNRWLVYATGGLAVSNWQVNMLLNSTPNFAVFNSDQTRAGWAVGGGAEVAIDRMWSVKAEYLYTDFGHTTGSSVFLPGGSTFTHDHSVRLVTQAARLGLNYRFGGQ